MLKENTCKSFILLYLHWHILFITVNTTETQLHKIKTKYINYL